MLLTISLFVCLLSNLIAMNEPEETRTETEDHVILIKGKAYYGAMCMLSKDTGKFACRTFGSTGEASTPLSHDFANLWLKQLREELKEFEEIKEDTKNE